MVSLETNLVIAKKNTSAQLQTKSRITPPLINSRVQSSLVMPDSIRHPEGLTSRKETGFRLSPEWRNWRCKYKNFNMLREPWTVQ